MFGWKEPPPSEEHFRKWTRIRNHGETYFVLTRGVLFGAICDLLNFLVIGIRYEHKRFDGLWRNVVGSSIGWLVGGLIAGSREWTSNEKRYQRESLQFSSANYESPEQTLMQLQRGMTNVAKH